MAAHNKLDLRGKKFGRLVVLEDSRKRKSRRVLWNCICDCGNKVRISSKCLRNGHSQSCGCLKLEILIKRTTKHGHGRARKQTATYRSWLGMKTRCLNPKVECYKHYGGRGITICERWMKFENFLEDMGEKPKDLTIERLNNKDGYSPENCIWATMEIQTRNKRNNRFITFNGESHILPDWAKITGLKRETISRRIARGWTIEKALTMKLRAKRILS